MQNRRFGFHNAIFGSMLSVLISACGGRGSSEYSYLEDVLAEHRWSLDRATSLTVFEQFVRYDLLGKTFALQRLVRADIEFLTSQGSASTSSVGVEPSEINASLSATVNNKHDAKVTVSYEPLGNAPDAYSAIKQIFDTTLAGAPELYGKVEYDNGQVLQNSDADWFLTHCNPDTFCVSISELDPTERRITYAFLNGKQGLCQFRSMLNAIRTLDADPKKIAHSRAQVLNALKKDLSSCNYSE